MITPNKVVSIENSALGLVSTIIEQGPDPLGLVKLYHIVSKNFESIDQFLLAIDLLFVLGCIDLDAQTGEVNYVG
ncbi:conserved hypothetical protein [Desulfosarcina cetonica]|uniref:ABC-three component system middle component 7 n=1 Tax=Desulfosarcina cetonica TaxID=90730 RepID=UPI0012EE5F3D|nr:ABC-three component system middle component 7 [Desulfosarcina cetonica]VTR66275.1 conserved hypothetical protein [Desulfosarcina cetonica]